MQSSETPETDFLDRWLADDPDGSKRKLVEEEMEFLSFIERGDEVICISTKQPDLSGEKVVLCHPFWLDKEYIESWKD